MRSYLLVVDLDNTLLGDDAALERFSAWHAARREWLGLVYASGRFYGSVMKSIRTAPLPAPEALICGLGTDLRHFESRLVVAGWRERVVAGGWSAERVRAVCDRLDMLCLQPDEFQSEFKVSYVGHQLTASQLARVDAALRDARLTVNLVYSGRRDLDILPAGVDKGTAAAYLVRRGQRIDRQVLVAGDSGNDLALFQQGFRGIVVANAEPALTQLAGPEVYVSPFAFADGVLDGLCHWLGEPDDGYLKATASHCAQRVQSTLLFE
ncbi:MAG TPA: HAD-IIB family hydrolase [Pirellulales bacterium]